MGHTATKGDGRTVEYLTCAETAKYVRAALKDAFPDVKFSVRSDTYAGGASINVGWTDGPVPAEVDAITSQYAGGGFDGMIDLAYHRTHYIDVDGKPSVANDPGTTGSGGVFPAYESKTPFGSPAAVCMKCGEDTWYNDERGCWEHVEDRERDHTAEVREVQFGADYIFTQRGQSQEFYARVEKAIEEATGAPFDHGRHYCLGFKGRVLDAWGSSARHQIACQTAGDQLIEPVHNLERAQ